MTAHDGRRLAGIARQLRRLRSVPSGVLAEIVARDGSCMQVSADDRAPQWLHEHGTDREAAARLCRGCPIQLPCLALELRLHGEQTVGVWGALGEQDRRALVRSGRPAVSRPLVGDAEPSSPPSWSPSLLVDRSAGGGAR
jgi:WhiB family transcriptional regulator, redox-sensing transcriptional regulator